MITAQLRQIQTEIKLQTGHNMFKNVHRLKIKENGYRQLQKEIVLKTKANSLRRQKK